MKAGGLSLGLPAFPDQRDEEAAKETQVATTGKTRAPNRVVGSGEGSWM